MANEAKGMVKLAFQSMFDLSGDAALDYMNDATTRLVDPCTGSAKHRDVSPAGAFSAAGDFIRRGIDAVRQKYPCLTNAGTQYAR